MSALLVIASAEAVAATGAAFLAIRAWKREQRMRIAAERKADNAATLAEAIEIEAARLVRHVTTLSAKLSAGGKAKNAKAKALRQMVTAQLRAEIGQ